jgi:hypothetical protein
LLSAAREKRSQIVGAKKAVPLNFTNKLTVSISEAECEGL